MSESNRKWKKSRQQWHIQPQQAHFGTNVSVWCSGLGIRFNARSVEEAWKQIPNEPFCHRDIVEHNFEGRITELYNTVSIRLLVPEELRPGDRVGPFTFCGRATEGGGYRCFETVGLRVVILHWQTLKYLLDQDNVLRRI